MWTRWWVGRNYEDAWLQTFSAMKVLRGLSGGAYWCGKQRYVETSADIIHISQVLGFVKKRKNVREWMMGARDESTWDGRIPVTERGGNIHGLWNDEKRNDILTKLCRPWFCEKLMCTSTTGLNYCYYYLLLLRFLLLTTVKVPNVLIW
jgi:hypothetical protein